MRSVESTTRINRGRFRSELHTAGRRGAARWGRAEQDADKSGCPEGNWPLALQGTLENCPEGLFASANKGFFCKPMDARNPPLTSGLSTRPLALYVPGCLQVYCRLFFVNLFPCKACPRIYENIRRRSFKTRQETNAQVPTLNLEKTVINVPWIDWCQTASVVLRRPWLHNLTKRGNGTVLLCKCPGWRALIMRRT